MPTLTELVVEHAQLDQEALDHLHRLVGAWQLIADLSFADLLLWCPVSGDDRFLCIGQMRPYTAQTLHPEDLFGTIVRPEELPVIDRAYHDSRHWKRDEPVMIDGVPVRMEAFPVVVQGKVVAVMTKEGAPLVHRRPSRLEQNYLECGAELSRMVEEGLFPFVDLALDPERAPRVGDGLIRLDDDARVVYASPNAVSAYRRLGVVSNIEGEMLDGIGVDSGAAALAFAVGLPAESDIEVGNTVVLQRAIPFLTGSDRDVTGALLLLREVTELRHRERQLERKDAVIREVHHRVKNNLQTIASLLRLQARRIDSVEAKLELEEAVRRIASIAVVHETLSRETQESVPFFDVARQLVAMVRDGLTDDHVGIDFDGDAVRLPSESATPLAVVLVELLQNAVEHAFVGKDGGTVQVQLRCDNKKLRLSVSDDGHGLPDGFSLTSTGLGWQIVKTLVEGDLEGKIEVSSKNGTQITLEIPLWRKPFSHI
ncbi:MAG: sensor histidine kinase [Actinomycetota bacterium]